MKTSETEMFADASAAVLPVFSITKVYVSVPFSVTVVGATDFEIERRGAPPAVTVSVAVTGVFIPSPLADTVLTIVPPAASGANPLTSAL